MNYWAILTTETEHILSRIFRIKLSWNLLQNFYNIGLLSST